MPENLENAAVATELEEVSFHSNPLKRQCKGMFKLNEHTIMLISHASKVVLKIFQARLQQFLNRELPDVQTGFTKGRGTRDQIANICGSWKKLENSRKTSDFASLTTLKPLCGWQQTGKFLKRWKYQTTLPASWEIFMQVKKQQLETVMEQQIGSKLGKEYIKAVYCHPAYLNYMQSTSCKMLGWVNHKLESNLPEGEKY